MGYLGRRIGKSQNTGTSADGADGNLGGGIVDLFAREYFAREGNISRVPGAVTSGHVATGGVINDYTDGSTVYRAHIFTSSGTFEVTSVGNIETGVEYLVVGGGGAGGEQHGGGGGAGGLLTNLSGYPLAQAAYPISVGPYTVRIGAGGNAVNDDRAPGSKSEFYPTPVSHPSPTRIRAEGGGGGGSYQPDDAKRAGADGGSGGGGVGLDRPSVAPGGAGENYPGPTQQGFPGGTGPTGGAAPGGAGGGGATAAGTGHPDIPSSPGAGAGVGGAGAQVAIAGPTATTFTGVGAKNPSNNQYQYFAGGGGGGAYQSSGNTGGAGGVGGGGTGANFPDPFPQPNVQARQGLFATGGGGGGSGQGGRPGGSGGSGICIIRYKLAFTTGTAKATGGAISFYGGKTIHVFTGSGTFATTSDWSSANVEYVVVGGGGAGSGGGGGAGAYRTGTTPIGAHPVSTTVTVGAGGVSQLSPGPWQGYITNGTPSSFGSPITSPGGGHGGNTNPHDAGIDGGSGGGGGAYPSSGEAGGTGSGDPFPGTIGSTPTNGWGNDGGSGSYPTPNPNIPGSSSGGGGGAGSAGTPAATYPGSPGLGGGGMQLPTTFRDPKSTIGHSGPTSSPFTGADDSGKYWLAGGGGGGWTGGGGGGGPRPSPYAGAGGGGGNPSITPVDAGNALANSGSGGGGNHNGSYAGHGGSGIVIIAYPT